MGIIRKTAHEKNGKNQKSFSDYSYVPEPEHEIGEKRAVPVRSELLSFYSRRFVSNVVFGFLPQVLRFGINAFVIGYLIRKLGEERWGLVIAATSAIALFSLLRLAAAAGIGKRLAAFYTTGDDRAFQEHYSAGVLLCGMTGVLMLGAAVAIVTLFWPLPKIPSEYSGEGQLVVLLVGVSAMLTTFSLPVTGCLQAAHRLDVAAKLESVALVARAVALVLLFELTPPRAWSYTVVVTSSVLMVLLNNWWWVRRNMPAARARWSYIRGSSVRSLLGLNSMVLFDGVNFTLFTQSPTMILQSASGLQQAGHYGIALQINIIFISLLRVIANALRPLAVSLDVSGQAERFVDLYRLSTKLFFAVAGMFWVVLAFLGPRLLELWLGKSIPTLNEALPWLLTASAVWAVIMPSEVFLVARERLKATSFGGLALAMGMIGCASLAAWYWPNYPLYAVSVVLTLFAVGLIVLRLIVGAFEMRMGLADTAVMLARGLAPPAAASLVLAAAAALGWTYHLWQLVTVTAVAGTVSVAAAYILTISSAERRMAQSAMVRALASR